MSERYHDTQYLELLIDVLDNGVIRDDRTGTGTVGVFGREMRFDLSDNSIPLLTTKQIHIKSIIIELLWYLRGESNVSYLQENGVRIWNEWADENGELGPVYPTQWRKWPKNNSTKVNYETDPPHCEVSTYIDQIANVVNTIKENPTDRRIIVSAWNVGMLEEMNLPPCHAFFQFYVNPYSEEHRRNLFVNMYDTIDPDNTGFINTTALYDSYNIPKGKLSCKLTQRSCDVFLGVPFNIAQYSILTHMIAQVTGLEAGEFIWSGGDVHIYNNHVEQVNTQLSREPYASPTLRLNESIKDIDAFTFEDFKIENYEAHPSIKAKVSV